MALSQRLTTALSSVVAPRLVPQARRAFAKAGARYTPAGGDAVVVVVAGTPGKRSSPGSACTDPTTIMVAAVVGPTTAAGAPA